MILYSIAWFILMCLAVYLMYRFIGIHWMVNFFPEGKRWWHIPVQWLCLTFFAILVLYNPWSLIP